MLEPALAERIAQACLREYARLPARGKPRTRTNGVPEWTVLSGFVLYSQDDEVSINVVSLGTGLKCLPANRLPLHGDVLHDSHAEIIARRGLMLWLYHQFLSLRADGQHANTYFETCRSGFRLRNEWQLGMYISTLPCGDASMKLLSHTQDPLVTSTFSSDIVRSSTSLSRGREGFNHTSALRTKPGRADSITTASMSCSDKLASWSVLGVQGALLAQHVEPLLISRYIFGGVPEDLQSEVLVECNRALGERLGLLVDLPKPYTQVAPRVTFASSTFRDARQLDDVEPGTLEQSSCPESLSWVAGLGSEVISQGIKQGAKVRTSGPQASKARSRICRVRLFELYLRLQGGQESASLADPHLTYKSAKAQAVAYKAAKTCLRGKSDAPFKAWLINDGQYQAFTMVSIGLVAVKQPGIIDDAT